ncbi:TIGR00266 family protein [Longispora albida]|uniref:TIGR00266 family protein n=1 Tax=Longispora albida TaxID=203523 RepID=UPI00035F1DBE|nr:TIGR00266 family protein [Longispora albida]
MTELRVLPDAGQTPAFSYQIGYRPAFALATLVLAPEQPVKAEAGAMVSMSGNVELESQMEGGLWGALKRGAGGRSAFVSTYTARGGPGELTLAPGAPGDIVPLHVSGEAYNVAASCYLAAEPSLEVETGWGGARSFFSSESMFVLQIRGNGLLFVTAYGALHSRVLQPGERYVVDTGHLVAWPAAMPYTINKATKSIFRSMTSGEGLVATFTGPGTLLMQTRNIEALAGLLRPFFPSRSGGGSE